MGKIKPIESLIDSKILIIRHSEVKDADGN
jgi:hypothetical protein